MSYTGYHFFVGDLELPYAPSELKVTIDSKNETVDLINGNEISILKSPKLQEIEFEVELPRGRQYPFANKLVDPKIYTDYFNKLLSTKSPTRLLITRPNPFKNNYSKPFHDTLYKQVSLEGYSWKENAENAYDLTVSLKFKEYVEYGTVKKVVVETPTSPTKVATPVASPEKKVESNKNYTVVKGDCLWKISKKFYGNGNSYKKIYDANKDVIEKTAKKYGKKSSYKGSTPGWWIYPGTKLVIPPK